MEFELIGWGYEVNNLNFSEFFSFSRNFCFVLKLFQFLFFVLDFKFLRLGFLVQCFIEYSLYFC